VQAERGEVRGAAERVARERSRQLRAVEGQGNHAAIGVARHAKPPAAPAVARRPGPVGVLLFHPHDHFFLKSFYLANKLAS
jgi:hypothetical protein